MSYAGRFAGIDIHVRPDHPKRQLPEDMLLSPVFRAEFNRWLAEFFGMDNLIKDGEAIQAGPRVFMNPRTYRALSREPEFQPMDPLELVSPRHWRMDFGPHF
jgi:hypothetical protein